MESENKILIVLIAIVIILGLYLAEETLFKPPPIQDSNKTFVNISYYGIHELKCPVCNATGKYLQINGHEEYMDPVTKKEDMVTLVYCTNSSTEFKAR